MAMRNFYPPIMPTIIPAFVLGTRPKIYFQISSYMNINAVDPQIIQVSVRKQTNNKSVVNIKKNNHLETYTTILNQDLEGYYIELDPNKIDFVSGEYYKVQVRFLCDGQVESAEAFAKNPNNYLDFLSEWSSVCLIRAISQPTLYLKGLDEVINSQKILLRTSSLTLNGKLEFQDENEIETLESYQVQLYEGNQLVVTAESDLIINSGLIYSESYNVNEITYQLKYNLKNSIQYLLKIQYTTSGGYSAEKEYWFMPLLTELDKISNVSVSISQNFEYGYNYLQIRSTNEDAPFVGTLVLKRASSEDNFKLWEDLQYFFYPFATVLNIDYKDYLIKHGVIYRYQLVLEDSQKNRSIPLDIEMEDKFGSKTMLLCHLNNISLINSDTERLHIILDPNISNFQYVTTESKTDTLGGKYPFIKRNGETYYRQFSISGLISHYCEEEDNEAELQKLDSLSFSFNEEKDDLIHKRKRFVYPNATNEIQSGYEQYYYKEADNIKYHKIDGHADVLLEREYREQVLQLLYANSVKLFRSPTEGNILVKLMNISLTPNQTLGRQVYSFTATALEVDDYSFTKCVYYNIHSLNSSTVDNPSLYSLNKIGQITIDENLENSTDVFNLISEHWTTESEYKPAVNYLKWVRISFSSPPWKIYKVIRTSKEDRTKETFFYVDEGMISQQNNKIISYPVKRMNGVYAHDYLNFVDNDTFTTTITEMLGYLIEVNGQQIVVPINGYYELAGDYTQLTSFKILNGGQWLMHTDNYQATLDFEANIFAISNENYLSSSYLYYLVGQLNRLTLKDKEKTIQASENIVQIIKDIHDTTTITLNNRSLQKVIGLSYLSIEGQPYTKVYIKDSSDAVPEMHMLNHTGILTLTCDNSYIEEVYFETYNGDDVVPVPQYHRLGAAEEEIIYNNSHLKDLIIDYVALMEGGSYG